MSQNIILPAKTENDIDKRVERVLKTLGNPEPPLNLADVREILKLNLAFFHANDPGMASEVISKIRVATVQVYKRPTLIIDVIKSMSLKGLYLPDRKRILLDGSLPEKKHRWNEAHEIGHSLIPWHDDMMHGDNSYTVSMACHEKIEAEANYAAGRLLFLRNRFVEEALSFNPGIDSIKKLHAIYGNTLSTTLYRYVESVGTTVPFVGLISGHPHTTRRKSDFNPMKPCRHFVRSPAFASRFSKLSEVEIFRLVTGYCGSQRGGPLGEKYVILMDDNGDAHKFYFETFFNSYDSLTLGTYISKEPKQFYNLL